MYYSISFSNIGSDFQCFEETHSVLVTHQGIMGVLCLGEPSHPHLPIILSHNKQSTKLSKTGMEMSWVLLFIWFSSSPP